MKNASEYTITRLHLVDSMQADKYQISLAGEVLAIVGWQEARAAMLGKIHPAALVEKATAVPV